MRGVGGSLWVMSQPSWQDGFRAVCEALASQGLTTKSLPGQGTIQCLPKRICEQCGQAGVFLGDELDCGEFYECASAVWCPACRNLQVISEQRYFAPWDQKRFLPVMKKKLIEHPQFLELVVEGGACPKCGGPCFSLSKDLGASDYYENTWTVCTNPQCAWPGSHLETFETGPYWA